MAGFDVAACFLGAPEAASGVAALAIALVLPMEMNIEEKSKSLVREKVLGLMRLNSTGLLWVQEKNRYRQGFSLSWLSDSYFQCTKVLEEP
ncbi:hypothetical protein K6W36_13430 [Acetobacter senegalensis]|uniref:hypothetical protein n=1 Tax=Acetobacter senegalensis TaxID=446692 RepID=UPI001EDA86DC|nr:hypothetical protein [Acetobacter senegalensis]MCG4261564.1 hypothetical protein [Acetobacter senegalensis]